MTNEQITGSSRHSETVSCQSCGMPMPEAGLRGSELNGTKSGEYCIYCYENGAFKQPEITLEEMTELCTGFMVEEGMEADAARTLLARSLPALKRWNSKSAAE